MSIDRHEFSDNHLRALAAVEIERLEGIYGLRYPPHIVAYITQTFCALGVTKCPDCQRMCVSFSFLCPSIFTHVLILTVFAGVKTRSDDTKRIRVRLQDWTKLEHWYLVV